MLKGGQTLLFLLGGLVAALISGTTGFGFAVVATALWSPLVEPQRVIALVLVLQFVLNLVYLPFLWRGLSLVRLAPLAAGAFFGVPIGAALLTLFDVAPLRMVVGIVLVSWSGWMLRQADWPRLELSPRAALAGDTAAGFAGGVLGGLIGLTAVLPALWLALRGGDKLANRGTVQGFILFSSVWAMFCLGRTAGIDRSLGPQLAAVVPVVVIGGLIGLRVFSRLDTAAFNRWMLWTVGGCGVLLVVLAAPQLAGSAPVLPQR